MSMTKERNRTPGSITSFIRELRHLMLDRDITTAGELHQLLVENASNGDKPARGTIYSYFRDENDPQPWFLRAVKEAFANDGKPLSEEEWHRLMNAYIESY